MSTRRLIITGSAGAAAVVAAFLLGLALGGPAGPAAATTAPTAPTAHTDHQPGTLALDDHAVAMAEVATAAVERRPLVRRLRALGTVGYNEAGLTVVPSRVQGYIEKLYVSAVGVPVRAGDHLAELYSPELIVAQQELLAGRDAAAGRLIGESARLKLRRFGIADDVIARIRSTGELEERLVITAPRSGTVVEKMVDAYAPVMMGMALYRIADLSSVWVHLAVHEQDLALVRSGQAVTVTSDSWPGERFAGRVALVEPALAAETRTASARVVIANPGQRLRPGMYVHADIAVPLAADGSPGPTGVEGRWTCPMHPEVLVDAPGPCPVCAMALERIPLPTIASDQRPPLAVPASAVLGLGGRDVVYTAIAPGRYRAVLVELGPQVDDWWLVRAGLTEGQLVVARGAFLIDSEAQIRGLPSLLAPEGGGAVGAHHGGPAGAAKPPPPPVPAAAGGGSAGTRPPAPSVSAPAPAAPAPPAPAPAVHKH